MAAINNVTLIGRVVRDIEIKTTNSGKSVASFALAVDGYGKDADASFIDCVAWNKAAELLAEYAPKGKQIGITGRLQTRIWEKDDIKRKATEVIIDQFQLLSDAKSGNNAALATEQYAEDDKTKTDIMPLDKNISLEPVNLDEIPF
jgi:single-strand binding protein|nr:MAG TPA: Single strand binding protein [Caudoviricetes sp.]